MRRILSSVSQMIGVLNPFSCINVIREKKLVKTIILLINLIYSSQTNKLLRAERGIPVPGLE